MSDVIDLAAARAKREAKHGVLLPQVEDHDDAVAFFADVPHDAAIVFFPFPDCGEKDCQSHDHGGFCMSRETARTLGQKLLKAAEFKAPAETAG